VTAEWRIFHNERRCNLNFSSKYDSGGQIEGDEMGLGYERRQK